MEKDVSIILVSYKTKELTKNCIKSICEKTEGFSYDIYVVDNNSQDGSCEMIRDEFPDVKLIENPENNGFGSANNIAIRESQSKYVFLLNTDTLLINNAIKILFDFMENSPGTGACGANLYDENMEHIHSYGIFQTIRSQILKTFGLRYFFPEDLKQMKDKGLNKENLFKTVDYITGADLMIRKTTLDKAGIFDERFFMYYEEAELQYRIKKHGFEIYILPEAQIIHLHNKSPKKKESMYFEFLKSKYLFFKLSYATKNNFVFIKMLMLSGILLRYFSHAESVSKLIKYIASDKL